MACTMASTSAASNASHKPLLRQQRRERAIDGVRGHAAQPLAQGTRSLEGDLVEVAFQGPRDQIFVAGAELVDEPELHPAPREPMLARCHLLDVELRPVRLDEFLEELVGVFELLLELLQSLLSDLAEHADGPLELAGGHLLEVDLVLLQQAMEVR